MRICRAPCCEVGGSLLILTKTEELLLREYPSVNIPVHVSHIPSTCSL